MLVLIDGVSSVILGFSFSCCLSFGVGFLLSNNLFVTRLLASFKHEARVSLTLSYLCPVGTRSGETGIIDSDSVVVDELLLLLRFSCLLGFTSCLILFSR